MKVVQFIALLLFSLVTGVFWGTWFSLSRSIGGITPETFLEIGRTMIGNLGSSMPFLLPAALVSGVVLCVLLFRHRQKAGFTLAAGSVALLLGAMVITLAVNVPIDRQIQSWTTTTLPSD